jgi:hypothetical protein
MYPNMMIIVSVAFCAVELARIGLRFIPGVPASEMALMSPAIKR